MPRKLLHPGRLQAVCKPLAWTLNTATYQTAVGSGASSETRQRGDGRLVERRVTRASALVERNRELALLPLHLFPSCAVLLRHSKPCLECQVEFRQPIWMALEASALAARGASWMPARLPP